MSERLGFVGLGSMGGPMCLNLLRNGFEATVFDLVAGAADPHLEAGAKQAQSLGDVARNSDVVLTMLPKSDDVETVILGDGGIAANGREGMLVIDMSTIFPGTSTKAAEILHKKGIAFLDAAVGRTSMHAAAGTSMFMVGGDPEDLDRARPILEKMGDTIHHCGPVGSGVQTKLVNNYLTATQAVITSEALSLAQKLGLDPQRTVDIMSSTMASNAMVSFYFPRMAMAGNIDPGFALVHARKDLGLAIELGEQQDVSMSTGMTAMTEYDRLFEEGHGQRDFSYTLMGACDVAGVEPPKIEAPDDQA
jgi:4-hydroxybutyrate dehydrogenase/sulfolactaldehyde 3-reductase